MKHSQLSALLEELEPISLKGLDKVKLLNRVETGPQPMVVSGISSREADFGMYDVMEFRFTTHDDAAEQNYYIFEAVKQVAKRSRYFYWQGRKYDYDTPEGKDLYEDLDDDDIEVQLFRDTTLFDRFIRLDAFTADPASDNVRIGNTDSAFHRIFLSDATFNGSVYSTGFFIDSRRFEAADEQEKGVVLIRLRSVSRAFYEYMLSHEKYNLDMGRLPAVQLTPPRGNIRDGLGVFGASARQEWSFYFDEL